ncbi:MAG: helix-turn-helix domain-containing protein [Eubacterium sp.]
MSRTNLFGAFLKEKRQEANMSLRELAHSIGVAHTYILNIENGSKAPPSGVMLKKIANSLHFDTQTAELFYDLAAMCKQDDDSKNLYIPTDISEYLQKTEFAKSAIRKANKLGYGNEFWNKIMKQLEGK